MEFTRKMRRDNHVTIPPEIIDIYDIKRGDNIVLDVKKVIKK